VIISEAVSLCFFTDFRGLASWGDPLGDLREMHGEKAFAFFRQNSPNSCADFRLSLSIPSHTLISARLEGLGMLKSIIRAVAAFMRSLPKLIVEKVWAGGRWITRLVATPAMPVEPEPEPVPLVADDGDALHVAAMRKVASHLASGSMPPVEAVERLRESDLEWLTALSKKMLCRVAVASDSALQAHIRRQRSMPGLLALEPGAVADFKRAARMDRERKVAEGGPAFAAA